MRLVEKIALFMNYSKKWLGGAVIAQFLEETRGKIGLKWEKPHFPRPRRGCLQFVPDTLEHPLFYLSDDQFTPLVGEGGHLNVT